MHKWGAKDAFPYVITIFSAPNYCGSYKNKASVLILKQNSLQLKQYQDTEPPYHLPEGLDLFSWSLPFLAEKVTGMLYSILKQCSPAELNDINEDQAKDKIKDEQNAAAQKMKRKLVLRNKIQSVGRMNKILVTMRQNQETLLELKSQSPDGRLPVNAILNYKPSIEFPSQTFAYMKNLDSNNEKRPPRKKSSA